jgi:hypothetical protein
MNISDLLLITLSFAVPLAVIWWAVRSHRSINKKIQRGDVSILSDSGFKIKRITQGPPGTQIYDDVTLLYSQQGEN